MSNMAEQVNKEKQTNLDSFITATPKQGTKRDQPSSSPDTISPSMSQAEKQARLASLGSSFGDLNSDSVEQVLTTSVQKDTVVQLSEVVCTILKNQEFIESLIPLISEKVMELIKPKVAQIVDECIQPHITSIKHNKDALILQELEISKQKDELKSLKNKITKLETRLEEQEQYSRRTSLRFNNVKLPTDDNGQINKPIDTDSLVLDICKKKLKIQLETTDIGRSHPIGEIRDGKTSIIVRFLSYRQRQLIFRNKRKLKDNPDNTFITENLTRHRYDLVNRLNTLRVKEKINSFWTHDGSVIVKQTALSRPRVVKTRQDIYSLGGEILEGDREED